MVVENFLEFEEVGVSANSTAYLNLESVKEIHKIKALNTLFIINTSLTTDIFLIKDGKKIFMIPKNNGTFQVEAKDILRFSLIGFKNETANVLTDELKVTYGVTGEELYKIGLESE